jgi:hypothetical protein
MRTRTTGAVVGLVLAAAATLAFTGGAAADGNDHGSGHLSARLTGEKEVPGPGDPDGSGWARVDVRPQRGEVCFEVAWEDISAPTAAHIHFGTRDVAGPVVVGLFMTSESPDQPPTLPETITAVAGCSDEVTVPEGAPFDSPKDLLRAIDRHPSRYYVNVHNLDYPAGAIRGQLHH